MFQQSKIFLEMTQEFFVKEFRLLCWTVNRKYFDAFLIFQVFQKSFSKSYSNDNDLSYSMSHERQEKSITRLLLMSYFPSGFWSRLITRILADDQIVNAIAKIYPWPRNVIREQRRTTAVILTLFFIAVGSDLQNSGYEMATVAIWHCSLSSRQFDIQTA